MGDQWKSEAGVARILESFGLRVERVNVGKAKTPDLLVSDGRQRYVVEVKDRLYDTEKRQRKSAVLDADGVWEDQMHLTYRNPISKVIRNAAEQLAAIPDTDIFRLVWLHARDCEEIQLSQCEATLYGSVDLIDLSEIAASVPARPCFYFNSSEFFRLKNTLDAAFVASDERGLLCVNNLHHGTNDSEVRVCVKSFRLYAIRLSGNVMVAGISQTATETGTTKQAC